MVLRTGNLIYNYISARQKSKGTGDVLWLKTVLSSGTLSDKVAALTLLIQESPLHTLTYLDSLLAMAAKKGKRESILAIGMLQKQCSFMKTLPCNACICNFVCWGGGGGGGGGKQLSKH